MIPGLWFEMENAGSHTALFEKEEWQLKRDGYPIQAGPRRFLDMRNPQVVDYLSERVIGLLKKYEFGYLKVDYNDNIGIGCDGAESLGEGLRQYVEASRRFFERIREELPDLVIENCASGGHRLEPSMQAVSSMSSFSDAHECITIPLVAANVQRAVLPEQSQIWAVLRAGDADKRLYYSMCNTFLGRMCLSGDIYDLTGAQWRIVEEGISFYQEAAPVIADGRSMRQGEEQLNYSHPVGYQAVVREGTCMQTGRTLAVVHQFYCEETEYENRTVEVLLPQNNMHITRTYCRGGIQVRVQGEKLCITGLEELEGIAVLLTNME